MASRQAAGLARRGTVSYISYISRVRRGPGSDGVVRSGAISEQQCRNLMQRSFHGQSPLRPDTSDFLSRSSPKLTSAILPRQYVALQTSRSYSSDLPPHQEIGMPSLSPTMTQGNIAKWRKKEGDQVAAGDVLCEIETDKATLEMESMEDGYLAKIIVGDGGKDIQVNQAICIMVEDKDDIAAFSNYQGAAAAAPKAAAPKEEASSPPPPPPPSPTPAPRRESTSSAPPAPKSDGSRIFASPAARKLAEEKNVSLSSLRGTGPDGRIVKADVEDYLATGPAPAKRETQAGTTAAVPATTRQAEGVLGDVDYTDIPNNQIKRVTARRLLQSKQTIPHYYLSLDTRVDKLLALREQLNQAQEAAKRKKLSLNDFVIKAAALATKKVPECNSSWTDDFIRQFHNVNISVAVQTDQGLMVPVVKDADRKGLAAISEDVKILADKARSNSLKPADYEGGTFTVSNLGGPFGIKQFCAIINPPQSCILAVGTTEKRVVPGAQDGEYTSGTFMVVTLSCDHRVVDGAIGAQWLGAFKGYIEDPMTLLL
ncbi:pyruvate dehydrogenase E2 component (dihydrolipoyllysine-residue acetyltransferase) [Marchantia polymorpha subsp. ruderalis]|nr:hypothetical protein MARPO_0014s0063 [Marchantia polymorpha]BBM98198.1 hypothetical protein Mp_1g11630 [Marchantia polymorpha subsp. ruderalis]|eukprot:PTQ45522.1 hypothetical protein MARPO_0014s0063 [Marchantia polymorpha]